MFNKYKQIKREIALKEQKKRLLWFTSVVRVNTFGKKLLRKARENIRTRNEQAERDRQKAELQRQNTKQS